MMVAGVILAVRALRYIRQCNVPVVEFHQFLRLRSETSSEPNKVVCSLLERKEKTHQSDLNLPPF